MRLLAEQDLSVSELSTLRGLRDLIQQQLSVLEGGPRFYYAGSFGKKTIIRQRYDLDIVMYWPNTAKYTIEGIYNGVGAVLKKHWRYVSEKTVSWELSFDGGFHIDVVPGRALDSHFFEANLHRTDTGATLKTSLKTHIDVVRSSGRRDVIRLMKLWRERNNVPFKKSFLLELLTIEACKGIRVDDIETLLQACFCFVRDNILTCNVSDPANSSNLLSDDLGRTVRIQIQAAAAEAAAAKYWADVFPI